MSTARSFAPTSMQRGRKEGIDHLRYPDEGLGRSQSGWSTKIHVRAEGGGKPMVLLITPGRCHEQTMFEPLMDRGVVKRRTPGWPRRCLDRVAGDKGYSSKKIRRYLRRRGMGVVIAR